MLYIYTLTDPITGQVRYIGKSNNCYRRFRHHLVSSSNPNSVKRLWIESLKKKGLKPILELLEEVSEEEGSYWEKYWMYQFKSWGFNLTNCINGNNTSFKKGEDSWNKGITGYTTNKQGQVTPQEIKDKISRALKGNSNKPSRKIQQLDLNNNLINSFISVKEAVKITGIKQSSISNALSGRSKTAGGYKWL